MDIMDKIIEAACRVSEIQQLRDKIIEARDTDSCRCGNCDFWMKSSSCPAEKNVKGRNVGPNMNAIGCNKFKVTAWVAELKQERLAAIKSSLYLKLIPDKEF